MEIDPNYGTGSPYDEEKEKDFEDRGSALGDKKKFFILLGVIAAVFLAVFLLYAFSVIPLLVANCVAVPVLIIAVVVWFKYRNRGM